MLMHAKLGQVKIELGNRQIMDAFSELVAKNLFSKFPYINIETTEVRYMELNTICPWFT